MTTAHQQGEDLRLLARESIRRAAERRRNRRWLLTVAAVVATVALAVWGSARLSPLDRDLAGTTVMMCGATAVGLAVAMGIRRRVG